MRKSTEQLLDKASRAIEAAKVLVRENSSDFAAGRAYYGMFYVAEALLNERGQHFRKHSAVHGAYGEYFAKTAVLDPKFHRWAIGWFRQATAGLLRARNQFETGRCRTDDQSGGRVPPDSAHLPQGQTPSRTVTEV